MRRAGAFSGKRVLNKDIYKTQPKNDQQRTMSQCAAEYFQHTKALIKLLLHTPHSGARYVADKLTANELTHR